MTHGNNPTKELCKILEDYIVYKGQYQDLGLMLYVKGAISVMLSKVTWTSPKTTYSDTEEMAALKAAIKCDDASLFELALPLFFAKQGYFQLMQATSSRYRTKWFFDKYSKKCLLYVSVANDCYRLRSCLAQQADFPFRLRLLDTLKKSSYDCESASAQFNKAVSSLNMMTEEDGKFLGDLVEWVKDDATVVKM